MKNLFVVVFAAFLLILLSGCIEVKTLVKLNNDGSGTVEETVYMNNEVVEIIKQFAASFSENPDSVTTEEFDLFDEEKLKSDAGNFGEGVTYISGEKLVEENKQGYRALYKFENINKLTIDQNPSKQIPLYTEEETEAEGDLLSFKFKPGNPAELIINMPDKDEELSKDESDVEDDLNTDGDTLSVEQKAEEAKKFLKDLSMSLSINVKGKIVETNATNVEESDITLFKIDFNELLENPETFNSFVEKDPQSFEEVKEIIKDIPGIKVELNNPVMVKFK